MLNYHKEDIALGVGIAVVSAVGGYYTAKHYAKKAELAKLCQPLTVQPKTPILPEHLSSEDQEAWRLLNSAWTSTEFSINIPIEAIDAKTGAIYPDLADTYTQLKAGGADNIPRITAKGTDAFGRKFVLMQESEKLAVLIYQEVVGDLSTVIVLSQTYTGTTAVGALKNYFQSADYEQFKRTQVLEARQAEAEFTKNQAAVADGVVAVQEAAASEDKPAENENASA